ncbi:MAG: hypothetical protein ACYCX2_12105 [Christensenellales bacterium]
MDLEKRNGINGRQEKEQPAVKKEEQKNKTGAERKKKLLKMMPVWILLVIPVILLAIMINLFSSQIHNRINTQIKNVLPEYSAVLENDYAVNYEYYRTVSRENKPSYVAMARITFNCKEGARLQSAKIDEIKSSFVQDLTYQSILGDMVVVISPVTFVYKDGASDTFCQNAFPLSDGGQSGGIVNAELYEPSSAPLAGAWLLITSWIVCWGIAYGYYRTKVRVTNELTDVAREGGLHKMTHFQDY